MTKTNIVLLTVLGVLLAVAICVGGWFGYWALAGHSQTRRYEVNTQSQQYQASLVSQERDRVVGYDQLTTAIAGTTDATIKAADQEQQDSIKSTFCAVYADLKPPTTDLLEAQSRICE